MEHCQINELNSEINNIAYFTPSNKNLISDNHQTNSNSHSSHKKFEKLKLYNKINIFNLLTIVEKVDYFFSNKKLLHYLLPQFSRKSILIFKNILKKEPYSCRIKLKKVFQFYYENKNYSNCEIFSAIFLYVKHLNEIYSEITLDFPLFDNEDNFHTSIFPLRFFSKDSLRLIESDFDNKFEASFCEQSNKKHKYANVNEIFADIIDPKKTILNITDNTAVDKYLNRKVYRINLLYFSKKEHSWSHFFSFYPQLLVFPKGEAFYENLIIGNNALEFNKNAYFKTFKNKVKNLSFEIYSEYSLAPYDAANILLNQNNVYSNNNTEIDDDIENRSAYFFELDNFIKSNSDSIETVNIYLNNNLISFFQGVLKNLLEMFKENDFRNLNKIKIKKYTSHNINANKNYIRITKRDIIHEAIDDLFANIENLSDVEIWQITNLLLKYV